MGSGVIAMRTIQHLSVLGATITTGLMAGLFFAFTVAIMPALRGADDRTFVDVMQRINVSILNPLFLSVFMGGLILTAAAGVLHLGSDHRRVLPWIIAGLVLYMAVLMITGRFNVPLNNTLDAAGNPNTAGNLAAVREHFENPWIAWNIARTLANIAACCCLAYGLVVAGRIDAQADTSASAGISTWDRPLVPSVSALFLAEPANTHIRGGDRPEQFAGDPHQPGGRALVGDERRAPVA